MMEKVITKVSEGLISIRSRVRFCYSKMDKIFALLLSVALIIIVVGCSDSEEVDIIDIDIDMELLRPSENGGFVDGNIALPRYDQVRYIVEIDRELFIGETLTIIGDSSISGIAGQYAMANPGVAIQVINTDTDEALKDLRGDELRKKISNQLIAGEGPVLIQCHIMDQRIPFMAGHFVDWFQIMEADPHFNQEEWITSVFDALSINGELFSFPSGFSFHLATINTTIPNYRQLWGNRDYITFIELMEIYHSMAETNPLYMDHPFTVYCIINFSWDNFMDFESGWVNFYNETFIELLSYARDYTDYELSDWREGLALMSTAEIDRLMSERYLYSISGNSNMYQYFLDFEVPLLFGEVVPVANKRGEVIIRTNPVSFAMNANAPLVQQALAWDFVKFTAGSDTHSVMEWFGVPINVELFHLYLENTMSLMKTAAEQQGLYIIDKANALNNLASQLNPIISMPMTIDLVQSVPKEIIWIIFEELERFRKDEASAEQTAADIQWRVRRAMEEMGIVVE